AARLRERVAAVENEVLANGTMPARAVFKFFPAQSEGDSILLYGPGHQVVETFSFPRQSTGEGLCLADFVAPRSTGVTDYVALFAVTWRRRARAGRALEGGGPLPRLAHPPGARDRGRRGVRRAAPPPPARDVGLPRPARDDHAGALQGALPRRAGELRLPRLPASRGPGEALPRPRRG